jgi:DNA-binding Xre family transcriptional regulator
MPKDVFDFDSVKKALEREIALSGMAPTKLSSKISKSNKSLVKNILDDGSDIKLSTLTKLAEELDVNIAKLIPWAKPDVSLQISKEALRDMMESAMRELPLGATVEDYLRVVPEGLHARLEQYLAGAASQGSSAGETALDKGAQPPSPTSPGAEG